MMKKWLLALAPVYLFSGLVAAEQPNYDSGKARVAAIIAHEETGVTAYNKKNCNYAETKNLSQDLNIKEIARYFNCKTEIGQSFLTQSLEMPLSTQDRYTTLAQRKQVIKALVENPTLKQEVEQLLERAKSAEEDIQILMSEFFVGRTCPELKQLELIKKQSPFVYPITKFFLMNPTARTTGNLISLISMAGLGYTTKILAETAYKFSQMGLDYTKPAATAVYCGFAIGFNTYQLGKDYAFASEKRNKLHALHELITIAERFESLSHEHDIKNQFKISAITDIQGQQLIQKLKSWRYKDKKSYIFAAPLVHTFLYRVYQDEKYLAELFACIAEMDAYNAIATKMIESQNSANQLCFAHIIDAEKPVICTEKFWNVLVANAVPNSLEDGKHIILTGPNAGGKTTSIRAILQNIVLAQSFGVAAAQKFEYTMFDVIHSYLNVSDDILQGLSLFASEVKRAQSIVQRIKALESGKKFFFALDELFTGTAAEDGETCAYEFVKRISEFDGVQFVYATHFNKLKTLGTDSVRCANYKVDAPTKNAAGKLVYPFTLSQGANNINVALDIAREAELFA